MRTALQLAALGLALTCPGAGTKASGPPGEPLSLWYREPATQWVEALPVGKGRLGAMIFGGIEHERIQFNEHTVWTGKPHDYAHPGAFKSLAEIRELLFQGKQDEAEKLAMRDFMSIPLRQKAYQAFGDLLLDFPGVNEDGVSGYRRDLNLDTAVSSVEYVRQGIRHKREVFASRPLSAIVVRVSADKPAQVSFEAGLKSAHADSSVRLLPNGELSMP
ncbi:MAG: glycoside hydrolase family 95 protein, partial [Bryobacteraceae bacterium]